jgi:hypothetical protein
MHRGNAVLMCFEIGMNVLAAPFLYVLPSEIEAFACFTSFIETCCPLYVQPTLVGVHRGLKVSVITVARWGEAPPTTC